MRTRIRFAIASLVTLFTIAAPRMVEACAVCFGDPEAPQRQGASYAVLVLLGVVGSVLAGFAIFFLHLRKQAKLAELAEGAELLGAAPGHATS